MAALEADLGVSLPWGKHWCDWSGLLTLRWECTWSAQSDFQTLQWECTWSAQLSLRTDLVLRLSDMELLQVLMTPPTTLVPMALVCWASNSRTTTWDRRQEGHRGKCVMNRVSGFIPFQFRWNCHSFSICGFYILFIGTIKLNEHSSNKHLSIWIIHLFWHTYTQYYQWH